VKVRIEWLNKKRCTVTLIPSWLGRMFGSETRQGIAYRSTYRMVALDVDGNETDEITEHTAYYWETTNRYVGWRVMRAIEAAPLQSVDEMSVEQLLLEPGKQRPR
jgi:hypothetical protein